MNLSHNRQEIISIRAKRRAMLSGPQEYPGGGVKREFVIFSIFFIYLLLLYVSSRFSIMFTVKIYFRSFYVPA